MVERELQRDQGHSPVLPIGWLGRLLLLLAACAAHVNAQGVSYLLEVSSWGPSVEDAYWAAHDGRSTVIRVGAVVTFNRSGTRSQKNRLNALTYKLFFDRLNLDAGGLLVGGVKYPVQLLLADDNNSAATGQVAVDLYQRYGVRFFLTGTFENQAYALSSALAQFPDAIVLAPSVWNSKRFANLTNTFHMLPQGSQVLKGAIQALNSSSWAPAKLGKSPRFVHFIQGGPAGPELCGLTAAPGQETILTVIKSIWPAAPAPLILNVPEEITSAADNVTVRIALQNASKFNPDVFVGCVTQEMCYSILAESQAQNITVSASLMSQCVDDTLIQTFLETSLFTAGAVTWTVDHSSPNTADLSQGPMQWPNEYFANQFLSYTGVTAAWQTASAFACSAVLMMAMQKAGSFVPSQVSAALKSNQFPVPFYGQLSFLPSGYQQLPPKVVQAVISNTQDADNNTVPGYVVQVTTTFTKKVPWVSLPCFNFVSGATSQGQMQGDTCVPCPYGTFGRFNAYNYQRTCSSCEPGTYLGAGDISFIATLYQGGPQDTWFNSSDPNLLVTCMWCAPGTYNPNISQTACLPCPPGTFQSQNGGSSCSLCPPGKANSDPGRTVCFTCGNSAVTGRRTFSNMAGSTACLECPPGAACKQNSQGLTVDYTSDVGYYILPPKPSHAAMYPFGQPFQCPCSTQLTKYKIQHSCAGNNTCLHVDGVKAMTGLLCTACTEGFGKSNWFGTCDVCPSLATAGYYIAISYGIILVISNIVALAMQFSHPQRSAPAIVVVIRIAITYGSCMSVLRKFISLEFYGSNLDGLLRWFGIGSGSEAFVVMETAGDCIAQAYFKLQPHDSSVYIGLALIPTVLIAGYCVFFVIKRRKPWLSAYIATIIFTHILILHSRVLQLFLYPFNCFQADQVRLVWNPAVICDGSTHFRSQLLAFLGYSLSGIGLPALLWFFLWKRKHKLREPDVWHTWGVFYAGFENKWYWFEFWFLFRQACWFFASALALLSGYDPIKADYGRVVLLMVALFFLAIHYHFKPYEDSAYGVFDTTEESMLQALALTLYVGLVQNVMASSLAFANSNRGPDSVYEGFCSWLSALVALAHIRYFIWSLLAAFSNYIPASTWFPWEDLVKTPAYTVDGGLRVEGLDKGAQDVFGEMVGKLAAHRAEAGVSLNYEELSMALQRSVLSAMYTRQLQVVYGRDYVKMDQQLRAKCQKRDEKRLSASQSVATLALSSGGEEPVQADDQAPLARERGSRQQEIKALSKVLWKYEREEAVLLSSRGEQKSKRVADATLELQQFLAKRTGRAVPAKDLHAAALSLQQSLDWITQCSKCAGQLQKVKSEATCAECSKSPTYYSCELCHIHLCKLGCRAKKGRITRGLSRAMSDKLTIDSQDPSETEDESTPHPRQTRHKGSLNLEEMHLRAEKAENRRNMERELEEELLELEQYLFQVAHQVQKVKQEMLKEQRLWNHKKVTLLGAKAAQEDSPAKDPIDEDISDETLKELFMDVEVSESEMEERQKELERLKEEIGKLHSKREYQSMDVNFATKKLKEHQEETGVHVFTHPEEAQYTGRKFTHESRYGMV